MNNQNQSKCEQSAAACNQTLSGSRLAEYIGDKEPFYCDKNRSVYKKLEKLEKHNEKPAKRNYLNSTSIKNDSKFKITDNLLYDILPEYTNL